MPQLSVQALAAKPQKIRFEKNSVILFQGDSITDSFRSRETADAGANSSRGLGFGYATMVAAELLHHFPDKTLKVYNRGISGSKVFQAAAKWDTDTLALKPNILSIMLGVNDFWHKHTGDYKQGTLEIYRNDFMALLDRTKKELPGVQLVVCEPFAVRGAKIVDDTWFPAFQDYQRAARDVAQAHNAVFVPFQQAFDQGLKKASAPYWTGDGVHPSMAGAKLMAKAWLTSVLG